MRARCSYLCAAAGLVLSSFLAPAAIRAQQAHAGAAAQPRPDTVRHATSRAGGARSHPPQRVSTERFSDWLRRRIVASAEVFEALTRVRGRGDAGAGERLMRLTVSTGQETELWRCDGCWSPATTAGGEIAVLREDGVWLVPPGQQPRLAVVAPRLERIVGREDSAGVRLLVARRREEPPGGPCQFDLVVANLSTGASMPVQEPEAECVEEGWVRATDQVYAGRVVSATEPASVVGTPRPRGLKWAGSVDADFQQLIPRPGSPPDGWERYDPIWVGQDTVVYVIRRWPAAPRR